MSGKMKAVSNYVEHSQKIVRNLKFVGIVRNSVVLRSMRKSGTNYLRLLVTNYVCNIEGFTQGTYAFSRVSYHEMHNTVFPNVRNYVFEGKKPYVSPALDRAPVFAKQYADFMYDHGGFADHYGFLQPKKLILIYRNPFDTIISTFFFKWKNRNEKQDEFSHPREVIDQVLPSFIKTYKWMRAVHARYNNAQVMLVSYEQLFLQPHSTLIGILEFLGLPVYPELVFLSAQASSIDETRKEEEKSGAALRNPQQQGLTGSFARSGKVGQWMEFFTPEDFLKIQQQLASNGIDYREFWLEAEKSALLDRYSAALNSGS
jgi:hypothetical protein